MRTLCFILLVTCWALAQSKLYLVGKVVAPVPGQRGCYIVNLSDGIQVKVKDAYFVEGLTPEPIRLEVTAIEGDSVLVRTNDLRVILSAGTEVGSREPLTVSAGQGAGKTGGVQNGKSASQERGPRASEESLLARERARQNGSIRDRYDDPVVSNGPLSPDQVFNNSGTYSQNDVASPMADFNNEQSRSARETTDGLPQDDLSSPYNRGGPSGMSSFEKGGKGSYNADLPATFVVEKTYFFLDSRQNVVLRVRVRNKGGQPSRFRLSCDCVNSSNRVVYSVNKELTRLEPGQYDYFDILTSLQPRTEMFGAGYTNSASVMQTIETKSFGEVRARPKVQALKD